jgi:hypothetical protein
MSSFEVFPVFYVKNECFIEMIKSFTIEHIHTKQYNKKYLTQLYKIRPDYQSRKLI